VPDTDGGDVLEVREEAPEIDADLLRQAGDPPSTKPATSTSSAEGTDGSPGRSDATMRRAACCTTTNRHGLSARSSRSAGTS
jgi:hypothetical protein